MSRGVILLLLLAAAVACASSCVVVLDEREQAFRTILSRPTAEVELFGTKLNSPVLNRPGVYLRVPFIHQLHEYDRRAQHFDAESRQLYMAAKFEVEVDYYLIWRVSDPQLLTMSIKGKDERIAQLDVSAFSAVREVLATHLFEDLLSEKRADVSRELIGKANESLGPKGIEVIDFRIRRFDFPETNLANVYARMSTERERFAKKYRAEGEEESRKIRSEAEKQTVILRAEGQREALRLQGEGDAEAARIYADAYGQDRDFYKFVRSLEAYRDALSGETTLVLTPNSPFLKYLFSSESAAPPTR